MTQYKYDKQIRNADDFRELNITSKDKLVEAIVREADYREASASSTDTDPEMADYLRTVASYLRKFYEKIRKAPLFNDLEDWWSYGICISCTGIALYIRYTPYVWFHAPEDESDGFYDNVDELNAAYDLIRMECRYLTIEEYAKAHDRTPSTVNVWIRRGKIRSAVKFGQKWMIPEMAVPPKREYQDATYAWDAWLDDVPEEYGFLSTPGELTISKLRRVKDMFYVSLKDDPSEPGRMTATEVAKLETYLIANPQVRYTGDHIYIGN